MNLKILKQHLELIKTSIGEDNLFLNKKTLKKNISKSKVLDKLNEKVKKCNKCVLAKTRTNTVFGEGDINTDLMFIGEAPGFDEDKQAKPFVGKAGQLLTKMIKAMGLKREDVYIANILKCRPPENRNPENEEIKQCFGYLEQQIKFVNPKVICTLGAFASQILLNTEEKISKLRGKTFEYKGIKVIPTFHPSYLLRNENMKKHAWNDLKLVMEILKS